jgi:hypothetical protein
MTIRDSKGRFVSKGTAIDEYLNVSIVTFLKFVLLFALVLLVLPLVVKGYKHLQHFTSDLELPNKHEITMRTVDHLLGHEFSHDVAYRLNEYDEYRKAMDRKKDIQEQYYQATMGEQIRGKARDMVIEEKAKAYKAEYEKSVIAAPPKTLSDLPYGKKK